MNRVYQNTFVNSILKFTQNLFFKATQDLKLVSQNSFSLVGNYTMKSSLKWIWVTFFIFSLQQSFSQTLPQLNNNNIPCAGCLTTNSYGYTTAALAVAGTGTVATTYNLAPNATLKQCATVKTDLNGTVGIINQILTLQPLGNTICTNNTAFTRKGSLYAISGGLCTGAEIPAVRKGTNSGSFNNEYVGLLPNTNYILVFTTTVDGSCTQYQTSVVKYYGGVTPQFTFNCGSASTTGSFVADGATHTGTMTVPITGTAAGAATFNVTGAGFTGTLTTTLTAGQLFVTIPISFDGSGSLGTRTLTVTSPNAGGTCSKIVTVTGNTAPVISSAAAVNYAENGTGTVYATTATDIDAGQTKTYSFGTGGVDNAKFTINATTGAVSFIASPDFELPTDAGGNNVYDIKVQVCDNGTPVLCAIKDVAITVTNIVECTAGTTAPTLSATTKSNVCPATTANLSSLVTSSCPVGSNLEWHTASTGLSAANKVSNPASVLGGTYYPTCYDATVNCYSPVPSPGVTVTINACGSNPILTPPATQTGIISTTKSGNAASELLPTGGLGAYTYTNGSADPACVAPVGATALPLSSALTINPTTGAYSYTRPASPGTYYFCVKVCDSSTPTPFCSVAVYKVVVTAPACNAGTTPPGVN
jgi:hypothetical protein